MNQSRPALIVMAIICFAFGLLMVGSVLPPFIDSTMSEDITENFVAVTGAGETSAVCGLTYEHYYGDTTNIDVISNLGTDDPFISAYNPTTYDTTVIGLSASGTRILSIDYARDRDDSSFTYFNTFVTAVPFLIGCGLVFMLIKSFF